MSKDTKGEDPIFKDRNLTILAGWLIDIERNLTRQNVRLRILDGYFAAIEPSAGSLGADAPCFLDLSAYTLLPPLVDCHVHLALSSEGLSREPDPEEGGIVPGTHPIASRLVQYFSHGILAVRDGGDPQGRAWNYVKQADTTQPIIVKNAGPAYHRPGHYGRNIGQALPSGQTLGRAIAEKPEPVDHIKIINSGLNSLTCFNQQTAPQFSISELEEAVIQAKKRGFKTMVHANSPIPVATAVRAGCDSIEHGFFMGKDILALLRDRGTTWVPTACPMQALSVLYAGNTRASDIARQTLDHQLEQISHAAKIGVPVALGTDAGSPGVRHADGYIEELRLLMQAGYTLPRVMQCASQQGAHLLGIKDFGRFAKNQPASFIAVKGRPQDLPESLKQVDYIFLKGQLVKQPEEGENNFLTGSTGFTGLKEMKG